MSCVLMTVKGDKSKVLIKIIWLINSRETISSKMYKMR